MFERLKMRKRISDLEEQMTKLARAVAERDLDWTELRARCKRLLDRTEKAAKRAEAGVELEEPQSTAAEGMVTQGNGHPLSPSQQRLQQQILRTRAARAADRRPE